MYPNGSKLKFVLIVTTTSVPKYKGFWLCPGHEHSLFWNGVSSIYQCLRPRLVGLWLWLFVHCSMKPESIGTALNGAYVNLRLNSLAYIIMVRHILHISMSRLAALVIDCCFVHFILGIIRMLIFCINN